MANVEEVAKVRLYARCSSSVSNFRRKIERNWGANTRWHPFRPTIFFGCYHIGDYLRIILHRSKRKIFWCGSDIINLERSKFNITSVEAADRENMGFLLLYLLPLFISSFETLNWDFWIPAIITFGAVVATGYSYHFNPLLGLMGDLS